MVLYAVKYRIIFVWNIEIGFIGSFLLKSLITIKTVFSTFSVCFFFMCSEVERGREETFQQTSQGYSLLRLGIIVSLWPLCLCSFNRFLFTEICSHWSQGNLFLVCPSHLCFCFKRFNNWKFIYLKGEFKNYYLYW